MPPFFPNADAAAIADALREAVDRRPSTIHTVYGTSGAGKTHSSLWAIHQSVPDHWPVIVPPTGSDDLAALVDRCAVMPTDPWVIWLDDVEDHVTGGLTVEALQAIGRQRQVVVVATVSKEWVDSARATQPGHGSADRRQLKRLSGLLTGDAAVLHRMDGASSDESVALALSVYPPECEADFRSTGVAPTLAGWPDLQAAVDHWQSQRDPARHWVDAVMALMSVGLRPPYALALVDELAAGLAYPDAPPSDADLAKACTPVKAGLAPLSIGWRDTYRVVDANPLLSRRHRLEGPPALLDRTLAAHLDSIEVADLFMGHGLADTRQIRAELWDRLPAPAVDYLVGRWVLRTHVDLETARQWIGRAAEAGHLDAVWTMSRIDIGHTKRWRQRAMDLRHPGALHDHARKAYLNGDERTAERLLRESARRWLAAQFDLVDLLRRRGHPDAAVEEARLIEWLAPKAANGDWGAAVDLYELHSHAGRADDARRAFTVAHRLEQQHGWSVADALQNMDVLSQHSTLPDPPAPHT